MSPALYIKRVTIPAQAGIHVPDNSNAEGWIPASPGLRRDDNVLMR